MSILMSNSVTFEPEVSSSLQDPLPYGSVITLPRDKSVSICAPEVMFHGSRVTFQD